MKLRTEEELKWIGVDFDGTIFGNTGYPEYLLTEPLPGAKDALQRMADQGWKIIIYTSRPWVEHEVVESHLEKHGIPFRRIVCGKMFVKYMVDDRNVEFDGDWDKVLKKIS